MLGISLDSRETLFKYIGGLHSYMRHTILMFNPTSIDEVSVQATHLEARGKNGSPEFGGSSQPTARKNKEKRKKKWKARKANTAQKRKASCTHYKKDGNDDEHCCILHPELRPKKFEGKKKKTVVAIQKDLGSDSGDETTTATTCIRDKIIKHLLVILHNLLMMKKMREKDMSFSIFELFPNIKILILCLMVTHK